MFCHDCVFLLWCHHCYCCHPDRTSAAFWPPESKPPFSYYSHIVRFNVSHCMTVYIPHNVTCYTVTAALTPNFLLTRLSAPPAITSDCGTLPSAGKVNSSPA